uniref:Uncharacterized protein n=1 Tax=Tanacetum cinerariifolium TaxID=118510 RepID=A0A699J7I3_TANCI|nr:hypothetical protein [Tanacetum cinerariifolium]
MGFSTKWVGSTVVCYTKVRMMITTVSGGVSCITTLGTVLGDAWDDDLDDQAGSFDGGEGGGGRRRRTGRRWTGGVAG